LTDHEFQTRSDAAIQDLNRALLRAAEQIEFDPDFQAGALTIEFESPREKYVVSPNAPVYQVWVSARVKSYKLDWVVEREAFVLAATGQTLKELLGDLIGQRVGESVVL
jgi:iron donor protein CyaY